MSQYSLLQRRLLAIALLCLVLLVLYSLIFGPLLHRYLDNREEISRLTHEMEVYERVIGNAAEDQQKLAQIKADNPAQDLLLEEPRPSLAAAYLQQVLNQIVSRSGGQLVSTQIIAQPVEEPIPSVAILVRLRCEIDQLVELLYEIETHRPLLFTENLIISTSTRDAARTARVRSGNREAVNRRLRIPTLDVRFDLIAYTESGAEQ